MSNIQKHRAFIESLEGEKGWPEYTYEDLRGDAECKDAPQAVDDLIDIILTLKRKQIPDLKEKVKEFGRFCHSIRSNCNFETCDCDGPKCADDEISRLCEPEKDSKEVEP